ncbi:unnamed protein product [Rhizophagus irregularis]|nr:unnamed protein product [Rhizophagus irregularis]CAB4411381.1 unnamed protein product [Rhizophagus irregularis]
MTQKQKLFDMPVTRELNEEETKEFFDKLVRIGHKEKVKELNKKYYEKNTISEGTSQDDRIIQLEQEKKNLMKDIDELLKEPKPEVQTEPKPEVQSEPTGEESSEDNTIENLLNELEKLTVDKTKKEKEIIGLEEKINKLENIVSTSSDPKRINELQKQTKELRGKLANKKIELAKAKEILDKKDDSVRKKIADLKGMIDSQQNTIRGLEKEKKENKEGKKFKSQLDKTQQELKNRIDELEHKLNEITKSVNQTQKTRQELEKMVEDSKFKLDGDKKNHIKKLFEGQEENDNSGLEDIKYLLGRKLDNKEIQELLNKKTELVKMEQELVLKILKIANPEQKRIFK